MDIIHYQYITVTEDSYQAVESHKFTVTGVWNL